MVDRKIKRFQGVGVIPTPFLFVKENNMSRVPVDISSMNNMPDRRRIKFVADSSNYRYGIMQEGNPSTVPALVEALNKSGNNLTQKQIDNK